MAHYGVGEASCLDCGDSRRCVQTTAFLPDLRPPPREAEALCPGCYVERAGRRRSAGFVRLDGDVVTAAARTRTEVERLVGAVADGPASGLVEGREVVDLADAIRDPGLAPVPRSYLTEVARGPYSELRGVYTSTSPAGTVLDARSHLGPAAARRLDDAVFDALRRRSDEVGTRDELRRLTRGPDSPLPVLAEHGVARRVEARLWRYLERAGELDEASLRSLRNQEGGREFEEYFEEYARERGMTPHRPADAALRRLHPRVHRGLERTFGAGLPGVPDYLVEVDGHASLGEGWRPIDDCFVEVKRGSSGMSRRQSKMAAHLKSRGFDVYVLRGEPGDHVFERR